MSLTHSADALLLPRLEPTRKLLLLALCLSCDSQGRGDLKPAELVTMTGLSERTIRSHRAWLTKQGFIEARPYSTEYRVDGRQLSYVLHQRQQ